MFRTSFCVVEARIAYCPKGYRMHFEIRHATRECFEKCVIRYQKRSGLVDIASGHPYIFISFCLCDEANEVTDGY